MRGDGLGFLEKFAPLLLHHLVLMIIVTGGHGKLN